MIREKMCCINGCMVISNLVMPWSQRFFLQGELKKFKIVGADCDLPAK